MNIKIFCCCSLFPSCYITCAHTLSYFAIFFDPQLYDGIRVLGPSIYEHTHTHTHTHTHAHARETRIKLFYFRIIFFYCSTLFYICIRLIKTAMNGIQLPKYVKYIFRGPTKCPSCRGHQAVKIKFKLSHIKIKIYLA